MQDLMTTLTYTYELTQPVRRVRIPCLFATDERHAHRLCVSVLSGGEPVDLSGARVSGTWRFLRTNTTVLLSGSTAGHSAEVVLPNAAYAQSGEAELFLFLVQGDTQSCIFSASVCVEPSSTDRIQTDADSPFSLSSLQSRLDTMEKRLTALTDADAAEQLVSAMRLDAWKFQLISTVSDESYASTAEAAADYDDSAWRTVAVPHDWSIEQDFNAASPAGHMGGFLDGGDAWYRTTVWVSRQQNCRYLLHFDGVYMESAVYVNGQPACTNCFGYNPFTADIGPLLTDGMNIIAVFVRSNQPNSRWYSGSGILRPVTLLTMLDTPVRMAHFRVTTPRLDEDLTNGEACVTFNAVNTADTAADCAFTLALYAPDGRLVSSADASLLLAPGTDTAVSLTAPFMNPILWRIGSGILYEAQVTARMNGQAVRSVRIPYGYRSIRFDKSAGFFLNGVHTKLKGVCLHHDGGCIGAMENRSAIERRIDLLLSMGCNAVRLAHNPFGEAFLDVCQRKGMMVVEELFNGWGKAKSTYDFARYFDAHYSEVVTDIIRRDWNNPAVILWSLGNEMNSGTVGGAYSAEEISAVCTSLSTVVKSLDATRPTTLGNNNAYSDLAPLLSLVDVVGINYTGNDQSLQTDRAIYGSETTCALSSRGVYETDSDRMVYTAYDTAAVSWGAPAAETVNEFLASSRSCGHFVWSGFDCIGEPAEWNRYPAKSSYFGIIDTCGFPKDIYYMYKSMWQDAPMIHILPHWTHQSGNVEVWLYSNCASVALYLNGTLLGRRTLADRGAKNQYAYTVAYAPGTLVANGYDASGNLVAQDVQYTAGSAAQLLLSADHDAVSIHSDDLVCITCDVADRNGTRCPNAENPVTFTVSGGTIVGTDNGYGACTEPYRSATRSAFSGKCLCVVRPDGRCGTMSVIASSDGLTPAVCRIVKGSTTTKPMPEASSFIDAENPPKREIE